jgi:hypothetical protein
VLLTRLDATGNVGTVSASRSGTDGATLVGGSRESRRAVVLTVRGGGGVFVARDGGKAELSGDSLSRSVDAALTVGVCSLPLLSTAHI